MKDSNRGDDSAIAPAIAWLKEMGIGENGNETEDLSWLEPRRISDLTTVQPEQILSGVLYRACKLVLMGASKSFKTWSLMDMAYCVGNGLPWWGIPTKRSVVVYLDFELLDYDFRWRMEQIAAAHGQAGKAAAIDAVQRIGLRGKTLKRPHWEKAHDHIRALNAGVVFCDPTYKLLGEGRDENAAGDIAQVTAIFDRLTTATGAAMVYAQHFSKGNQAAKESIDRAAGSGVWARDADSIIVMTKHSQEECLTIETTLRSFPRIEPYVVRWSNPLFVRATELDPQDLKQGGGRGATFTVQDLVDCLGDADLKTVEFEKLFHDEVGGSRAVFYKLLKKAEQAELLHKSRIDHKWERVKPPQNHK